MNNHFLRDRNETVVLLRSYIYFQACSVLIKLNDQNFKIFKLYKRIIQKKVVMNKIIQIFNFNVLIYSNEVMPATY